AQMAQDGLARAVEPAHTPWDGDTVFAVASGTHGVEHADVGVLGALAADVLATAIVRGVEQAEAVAGYPSVRHLARR
ncbi:MAG: P1 family peptidase, partial [Deltaproteobacteria bacterium]|nr:P1 family peptidase [Deltaproteobacteria bacterium]